MHAGEKMPEPKLASRSAPAAPTLPPRAAPQAAALVRTALAQAYEAAPEAALFAQRLLDTSAVRLLDLIDSLGLQDVDSLNSMGWRRTERGIWRHEQPGIPDILERDKLCVAFRVERLDHLLDTLGLETPIEGQPFGVFRRARVFATDGVNVDAVERNGGAAHEPVNVPEWRIRRALIHQQIFRTRRRDFRSAERGMREARRLISAAVADLGPNQACDLFLRAEREHWMRWCSAGLLQYRRQQRAGVGWSNIDHHAYVASREHVHDLIELFVELGFRLGEILRVDGWARQLLEHPVLCSTIAVDVDLDMNEELDGGPLPPPLWHGGAGAWADLHGESLLEAGLHHVGCLLDRSAFAHQAQVDGITLLPPSSDRSAFFQQMSLPEERAINPRRIDRLEREELLTPSQAEQLRLHGGSAAQLECIERNGGFTGYDAPMTAPVIMCWR
jgi:hypothetical protein